MNGRAMTKLLLAGAALAVATALAAAAATGGSAREGGVFRIAGAPDAIDPAITIDAGDALTATCARLLASPDKPPPDGTRLVPEAAVRYPAVSRDGKTYTFTIRRGIRFNTGEAVTAQSFAHGIERILDPATKSPWLQYVQDIVGADAVSKGTSSTASGVVARGDKLIIRLTHPASDFAARLTNTTFCAVPADLPVTPEGVTVLPGAGPYYVDEFVSGQKLVLKRNPLYRGSRPHHVDEISFAPASDPVRAVETGAADYAETDPIALAAVGGKYRAQLHAAAGAAIRFVVLNSSRGLFRDNALLRQAVNFAIDRPALIRERGGPITGRPTDQYLPASMSGFVDAKIYPLDHPNLAKAKALARGHTRTGNAALWIKDAPTDIAQAQIVQRDLTTIGIKVSIRKFPGPALFQKLFTPGSPYDMTFVGFGPDYFDPYAMLNVLFDGRLIGTPYSFNLGYFNSPKYNTRLDRASRLTGSARYRAYGKLDIDLSRNEAPSVAYENESILTLVSKRAGCLVLNPLLDLAAVCLK
jgi:peptide/nickel transport system substrate-binding protein